MHKQHLNFKLIFATIMKLFLRANNQSSRTASSISSTVAKLLGLGHRRKAVQNSIVLFARKTKLHDVLDTIAAHRTRSWFRLPWESKRVDVSTGKDA